MEARYGRFALVILRSADADIDFRRFDNDGPDGVPDSGDDDGLVDVLFLSIASAPTGFLLQEATGIADLGFDGFFLTDDVAADGTPIRVDPRAGMIQAVPDQTLSDFQPAPKAMWRSRSLTCSGNECKR